MVLIFSIELITCHRFFEYDMYDMQCKSAYCNAAKIKLGKRVLI